MSSGTAALQPPFLYTRDEVATMDPLTRKVFDRALARGAARITDEQNGDDNESNRKPN